MGVLESVPWTHDLENPGCRGSRNGYCQWIAEKETLSMTERFSITDRFEKKK